MGSNNNNGQNVFGKVTFIIATASAIIGIVLFITGPDAQLQQNIALIKQKVETIQTNHLQHLAGDIQDGNDKIEKNAIAAKENRDAINELDKKLIKIMAKLGVE